MFFPSKFQNHKLIMFSLTFLNMKRGGPVVGEGLLALLGEQTGKPMRCPEDCPWLQESREQGRRREAVLNVQEKCKQAAL